MIKTANLNLQKKTFSLISATVCYFRNIYTPWDISVRNTCTAQYIEFHSIIRLTQRLLHALFSCAGGLRRTVGLYEESSICHRIWDLILGCVRQLAHMVGFPHRRNKLMNMRMDWTCLMDSVWWGGFVATGLRSVRQQWIWTYMLHIIPMRYIRSQNTAGNDTTCLHRIWHRHNNTWCMDGHD